MVIRILVFLSLFFAQLELTLVVSIQYSCHTLAITLQAAGMGTEETCFVALVLLCFVSRSHYITEDSLDFAMWFRQPQAHRPTSTAS